MAKDKDEIQNVDKSLSNLTKTLKDSDKTLKQAEKNVKISDMRGKELEKFNEQVAKKQMDGIKHYATIQAKEVARDKIEKAAMSKLKKKFLMKSLGISAVGGTMAKVMGKFNIYAKIAIATAKTGQAIFSTAKVAQNLGKREEDITDRDRAASGAGALADALSFGIFDEKVMSQSIVQGFEWWDKKSEPEREEVRQQRLREHGEFLGAIMNAGKAMESGAFSFIGGIVDFLFSMFKGLTVVATLIAVGIAGMAAWTGFKIIKAAWDTWKDISKAWEKSWGDVKKRFEKWDETTLGEKIGILFCSFGDLASVIASVGVMFAKNVVTAFLPEEYVKPVEQWFDQILCGIKDIFKGNFAEGFGKLWEAFWAPIGGIFMWVFDNVVKPLKGWFDDMWKKLPTMSEFIDDVISPIKNFLSSLWDMIPSWDELKAMMPKVSDFIPFMGDDDDPEEEARKAKKKKVDAEVKKGVASSYTEWHGLGPRDFNAVSKMSTDALEALITDKKYQLNQKKLVSAAAKELGERNLKAAMIQDAKDRNTYMTKDEFFRSPQYKNLAGGKGKSSGYLERQYERQLGGAPLVKPMFSGQEADQIKKDEGFRKGVYDDTMGIKTIGYGFNLERAGAQEALDEAGIKKSLADFKSGKVKMTEEEASRLMMGEMGHFKKVAKEFVNKGKKGTWAKLTQNRQGIITNMAYNMGAGTLNNFKNLRAAIQDENWAEAQAQMRDSNWSKQTKGRADRLIARMGGAQKTQAMNAVQGGNSAISKSGQPMHVTTHIDQSTKTNVGGNTTNMVGGTAQDNKNDMWDNFKNWW
jgi:lysozyme